MRRIVIVAACCLLIGAEAVAETIDISGIDLQNLRPEAPWIGFEDGGVTKPDEDGLAISGALDGWSVGRPGDGGMTYLSLEQWFMVKNRGTPPTGKHQLRRYPKRTPRVDWNWPFAGKMCWTGGDFPGWSGPPMKKRKPKDFFKYVVGTLLGGDLNRSRYALGFAISTAKKDPLFASMCESRDSKGLVQTYHVPDCQWSVFSFPAEQDDATGSEDRQILQVRQGEGCFVDPSGTAPRRLVKLLRSKRMSFTEWEDSIRKCPNEPIQFSLGWLFTRESVPECVPDYWEGFAKFLKKLDCRRGRIPDAGGAG
jgi:hypothetical protein